MRKKYSKCYLCQSRRKTLTRDHVIPKCLFPKPRPANLITLPACEECQKKYAKDEQYFLTNISAISNQNINEVAKVIWQKVRRSYLRRRSLHNDLSSRMARVEITTPSGLYLKTETVLKIPKDRTNKVLTKIAKGLFLFHTQSHVPENFVAEIYLQPKDFLPDLLKKSQFKGVFEDIFTYAGAVTAAQELSIWWMSIFKSVLAIVILKTPEI